LSGKWQGERGVEGESAGKPRMRREIAAIQALKCIMMSGFWRPWKMGSRERKFFSFQNCCFRGSARRKRRLRNGEVGGLSEVDEGERRGCLEGKLGERYFSYKEH
jgi:hypothetical protein